MAERIMTERQVKEYSEKMRKMRGSKERKISTPALRKKTRHHKAIDPDKTKEYETRFNNIWVVIKGLESRIIELESKEKRDELQR